MLYIFLPALVLFFAWLLLAPSTIIERDTQKKQQQHKELRNEGCRATSTSVALEYFLSTPLQDIALTDVPGVGEASLKVLFRQNIRTTEQLFGYFLYLGRKEHAVRAFLRDIIGLQGAQAKQVYDSMTSKAQSVCATGGRGYGSSAASRSHQPSSSLSTSVAKDVFMSTPLEDISIDQVPGVGSATLPRLTEGNIFSGEALFGYFLYLGRDEGSFRQWLKDALEVHGAPAKKVYESMRDKADVVCVLGARA